MEILNGLNDDERALLAELDELLPLFAKLDADLYNSANGAAKGLRQRADAANIDAVLVGATEADG